MTTIAYKDGILAADTQITFGGDTKGLCHKIERLSNGWIVAIAGNTDQEYWFKKFLLGEKFPKANYKFRKVDGILIKPEEKNKVYYYNSGPEEFELQEPFYALGNGYRIARAGMHIGLSAKEAVKLAGEVDIFTNKKVDTYDTKHQKITYGK